MIKNLLLSLLGAFLFVSCGPLPQPSSNTSTSAPSTSAAVPNVMRASGNFDYYLLTLSWSPEFCHGHPESPECGEHLGFIVHGLWPQFSRGGYPENCSQQQPGPSNPQAMLDLIPDQHLIEHEWVTHGACTGLSGDNYFALVRRIRDSVRIPQDLVAPSHQLTMASESLKQDFEQANPGLNDSEMAVTCGGAPYLTGIELCFSKDGRPIPCGNGVRDCERPELRIPRVQ